MWKNIISSVAFAENAALLCTENILRQQVRTTYILKRKFPAPLKGKGCPAKTLRSKHYIYELVKNTLSDKQPTIDVILKSYVDGLGNVGDKVNIRQNFAYDKLLLPGLAVYATPENCKLYESVEQKKDEKRYSSTNAILTARTLATMSLSVVMNKDTPWVLQPWHVKVSFRKCCYNVPEDTITLPEKPIKGPDMSLEDKQFYVTVTINNTEKVRVRCRIHHWSTDIRERLPYIEEFWKGECEPIFKEQQTDLEHMPPKGARISSDKLSTIIQ